jgi:hypothetical protein
VLTPKEKEDCSKLSLLILFIILYIKYDKRDQQGKAAFNERNPHTTQQHEPMAQEDYKQK